MALGESRSQGSQNGICAWRQDKESVTEHQRSQNEPLWELKWPLSACSGRAQVKAAAAHVQTLKRNQRKKKFSVTYVVDFQEKLLSRVLCRVSCQLIYIGLALCHIGGTACPKDAVLVILSLWVGLVFSILSYGRR
jgi:hypothetical protein